MKQRIVLTGLLLSMAACRQTTGPASKESVADSSLISVPDTVPAPVKDTLISTDTVTYNKDQLLGRWLQPVPGLEKEMQGFYLKRNGIASSINTYSLVYQQWRLMHDTLLLWSRAEGAKDRDTIATIDTAIIKGLTDTSLVLYPTKAAEGYLEKYRKERTPVNKKKKH